MDGRRLLWAVVVAGFLVLGVAGPVKMVTRNLGGDAAPADGGTVVMEGLAYRPATLTVRRGATVAFVNRDVAPHTVTADKGYLDSGDIAPGGSFRAVVDEPVAYRCLIHPSMTARILLSG